MDELKRLIDILERKGKSSASALLNYSDHTNLETRLYLLAKEDEPKDESLIIEQLYNTSDKSGAYKMLKSRVKRKLYNQLLFFDSDNYKIDDELPKIELRCRRYLFLAKILRLLKESNLSEQQLNKALAIAEEANLVKYQIDALEQLQTIIAEQKFSRKQYEECVLKLEELYRIDVFERKSNTCFLDVRFILKLGVEANKSFKSKLVNYIDDVHSYWLNSGSSKVFYDYHRLKMLSYEFNGDAESLVNYLEDTFQLFEAGKIHPLYFSINFNKYLLVFGYLRAKQYNKGLSEAEQLKHMIAEGSRNWFAHMENYYLLAIHSKLYNKAEEVMYEVLSNKNLKQTTTFSQERWQLFYQFLKYITGFSYQINSHIKFKHVPQDKKGYNVWALIHDCVLALDKKQADLIEREIDRLRKFIANYLVDKEDARTKLFLKLLQVAGREYSDAKVCRRKGTYLFNKLQKTPVPGIAYAETEIVPYEHLWELILAKMESKK